MYVDIPTIADVDVAQLRASFFAILEPRQNAFFTPSNRDTIEERHEDIGGILLQ